MNTDKKKINTDAVEKYKYQDITGLILKAAFEVHNTLGCGFWEKVYERALICELKAKGLTFLCLA